MSDAGLSPGAAAPPDDAGLMRDAAGLLNVFGGNETDALLIAGRLRRRADELVAACREGGSSPDDPFGYSKAEEALYAAALRAAAPQQESDRGS